MNKDYKKMVNITTRAWIIFLLSILLNIWIFYYTELANIDILCLIPLYTGGITIVTFILGYCMSVRLIKMSKFRFDDNLDEFYKKELSELKERHYEIYKENFPYDNYNDFEKAHYAEFGY